MGKGAHVSTEAIPQIQTFSSLCSDSKVPDNSSIRAGQWAHECDNVGQPRGGWFGLWDCITRYLLTVFCHYWNLITSPLNYIRYTYHYNRTWYGHPGLLLTAMVPVLPLGIVFFELFKKTKDWFSGPDWMMSGPGRVFFVKPANPIADLLWSCYLTQSMYVGQYLFAGTSADAISHTWVDTILTKDFWRAALTNVGARVPREMGRWNGRSLDLDHVLDQTDLVIKVPDSYLGIGDSFWNFGLDYNTQDELVELLKQKYPEQEVLVLELVRPKPELGVHSLDIVTIRTPQDDVKVLSVLLWTDCTTDSSHSCQAGYVVDADTGLVVGAASWYCAAFSEMKAPLVGSHYPGVKEACQKAVAAHKAIDEKWVVTVGWDAMVQKKDLVVFFEGNFAGARTPRRIFLSPSAMMTALRDFFWPWGTGNSVQPHANDSIKQA